MDRRGGQVCTKDQQAKDRVLYLLRRNTCACNGRVLFFICLAGWVAPCGGHGRRAVFDFADLRARRGKEGYKKIGDLFSAQDAERGQTKILPCRKNSERRRNCAVRVRIARLSPFECMAFGQRVDRKRSGHFCRRSRGGRFGLFAGAVSPRLSEKGVLQALRLLQFVLFDRHKR